MPTVRTFALLALLLCGCLGCAPSDAERLLEELRSQPLDVSAPPPVCKASKRQKYQVERRTTFHGPTPSSGTVKSEAIVKLLEHCENGAFRAQCTYARFKGDEGASVLSNLIADLPLVARFDRYGRMKEIENYDEIKKAILARMESPEWPTRASTDKAKDTLTAEAFIKSDLAREFEYFFVLQGRSYSYNQPIEEQRLHELGPFEFLDSPLHIQVTDRFVLTDFRSPPYADAMIDFEEILDLELLGEAAQKEKLLQEFAEKLLNENPNGERKMKFELDTETRWPTRMELNTKSRKGEELQRSDQCIMTLQGRP